MRWILGGASLLFLLYLIHREGVTPLLGIEEVLAEGTKAKDLTGEIAKNLSTTISFLQALAWIFFVILSFLLDPKVIFAENTSGSREFLDMLNNLWQLSRDLMNVVFAFALVGAALYTIVTANKELIMSSWRKFLLAVVLVNFSWFFGLLVIDVANVTASAIFGIPALMMTSSGSACVVPDGSGGFKDCEIVTNVSLFEKPLDLSTGGWKPIPGMNGSYYKKETLDINTTAGYSTVLNGLIVNFARLEELSNLAKDGDPTEKDISKLLTYALKLAIAMAIHVALFFPLAALVVAFLIRIPVLWVGLAFLPFLLLSLIGGDRFQGVGKMNPKELLKLFVTAAFLPALVAIPFAIGLTMMVAGTLTMTSSGFPSLAGAETIKINVFSGIPDFFEFIWLLVALGIIYQGVFMILKGQEVLGMGAQAIQSFGNTLGKLALKAPLAAPVLPGGMTPLGVLRLPQQVLGGIESGTPIRKAFEGAIKGEADRMTQINESAKNLNADSKKTTDLNGYIGTIQDANTKTEDLKRAIEKLKDTLQQSGIKNAHSLSDSELVNALRDLKNKNVKIDLDTGKFQASLDKLKPQKTTPSPTPAAASPAGGAAPPPNSRAPGSTTPGTATGGGTTPPRSTP